MGRTNGIKARVIVIHRRWPRSDGNRRVLRRGGQSPNLLAYRWPTSREETLGIRCGPYRRRAHESRGVRKFAFDWRQGSRGSGHTILVNSRSPEALISHDSAPMQSTSVAAQFLTIQAFSRKCPIGHALDISFEPPVSLRVTPRRRENGVGLPADADVFLGA